MNRANTESINALLPQTQCTQCGYAGCRPYAQAMASGEAPINRCPPGGAAGIARLAALLDTPEIALDPACGAEGPRSLARIESDDCIGCTKCIQACPVDAIIGASKRMHWILPALCTGCELCVPPCPTDCIRIEPFAALARWSDEDASAARHRYESRAERLRRERHDNDRRLAARALGKLRELDQPVAGHTGIMPADPTDQDLRARKRAAVAAAMQRANERIQAHRKRQTDSQRR